MKDADKVINVPMTKRLAGVAAVNAQMQGNKHFVDGSWDEAGGQFKIAANLCQALAKAEKS